MSCRGKTLHALGQCDCCFKPADFLALVEKERRWFELVMRVESLPQNAPLRTKYVMLTERARWLRN